MRALVGKYLVWGVESGTRGTNGNREWRAEWCIHHSPSGNGRDWQTLKRGPVEGIFTNVHDAVSAGYKEGVKRARELQGDDTLEPVDWCHPFPDVGPSYQTGANGIENVGGLIVMWGAFGSDGKWAGIYSIHRQTDKADVVKLDMIDEGDTLERFDDQSAAGDAAKVIALARAHELNKGR